MGIAEDWNRGVASNRRQVHGPTRETSLPTWRTFLRTWGKVIGYLRREFHSSVIV